MPASSLPCDRWGRPLLLLALALTCCGESSGPHGGGQRPTTASEETVVDRLFLAARAGKVDQLRALLADGSAAELEALRSFLPADRDPWMLMADVLARMAPPRCVAGAGSRLECESLGRRFELALTVGQEGERLVLPSLSTMLAELREGAVR